MNQGNEGCVTENNSNISHDISFDGPWLRRQREERQVTPVVQGGVKEVAVVVGCCKEKVAAEE